MEETMKQFCLGIIVAIGLTLPAFGQQAVKVPDGIYQLNHAKSTIRGPIGKSQTLNVEGDAITSVGFGENGKPYSFVSIVITDGKPRASTNTPWDTSTYTQLDPYTVRIERFKAQKPLWSGIRLWSPESKTLTLTVIAADGSTNHVLVFEKQ
jgi:hypothetical protein